MADFVERCIQFLPDVEVCCYSLSLFVGSIISSLVCLAYFIGQMYKGLGFTVGYYIPEHFGSANSIFGLIHMIPTTLLICFALVGALVNCIYIMSFFFELPRTIGTTLVFCGLLVVLFELIWILLAFIRAFLGGGAMYSCNASHTHEICTDDIAALGFLVSVGFAIYCLIVIKSYLYEE